MKPTLSSFRVSLIVSFCCLGSFAYGQASLEEDAPLSALPELDVTEETGPAMSALEIAKETAATSNATGVQVPLTLLAWISALSGTAN